YYVLNSHTLVLVPDTAIKSILTQQELGSQRGTWIAKVQEYDLDIRPTKLVRGRGLCQLIAENHAEVECEKTQDTSSELPMVLF
ncbi:hypothetical protein KI387_004234, partial [Taxus chinensis]